MKVIKKLCLMSIAVPLLSFAANQEPIQQFHKGEYNQASEGLSSLADKNDPKSAFLLGKMYVQGLGVAKNFDKGFDLILKSAKQKYVPAQMYVAKYYLNQPDQFQEAFDWFKKAADLNNVDAQMFCATAYLYGFGTKQNTEKARKYIIQAAKNGNAVAQYELAKLFLKSKHRKDRAMGLIWLKKATAKNNADAQYLYATLLYSGHGVTKNTKEAIKLFKSAAEKNNPQATEKLGNYYLSLPRTPTNFKEALFWLEKSATAGNTKAQYKLGKLLLNASESFKNTPEALKWLAAAAKQNDPKAQQILASIYEQGVDVEKDLPKAFALWLKLAKEGNIDGQRQVGIMYYEGEGVKKNNTLAAQWLEKAASQNDYIAKFKLESINKEWDNKKKDQRPQILSPKVSNILKGDIFQAHYSLMPADEISLKEFQKSLARLQYQKITPEIKIPKPKLSLVEIQHDEIIRLAKHRYAPAEYQLGLMYQKGFGVKKDLQLAIELYERSAKKNYLKADYVLGILSLQGIGMKKNYDTARELLTRAALHGDENAQYLLGQIYEYGLKADSKNIIKKNLQAAKAFYRLAATNHMPQAEFSLARLYASGVLNENMHITEQKKIDHVTYILFQDAAKAQIPGAKSALAYYDAQYALTVADKNKIFLMTKELAENNKADAKLLLAILYNRGIGTSKDTNKALDLFKELAKEGNPVAEYILGTKLSLNKKQTGSLQEAYQYLTQASKAGLPYAKYNLAMLEYHDNNIDRFIELMHEASKQNYQPASIALADYYLQLEDNNEGLKFAVKTYQNLASNGNVDAQIKLAFLYQHGIYFQKNYTMALEWYEKAAQANSALAQYALGQIYQVGQGVQRNVNEAINWYTKSAKQDFSPAKVALGFINEVDKHNYLLAKYWYQQAEQENNPLALYNLGLLYEYGKGVKTNLQKAQKLYSLAAQQGVKPAEIALIELNEYK